MGAVCCVAAKSKTVSNGPRGEVTQRHACYSPSWSFRRDNRGRVTGEEISSNCLYDGGGGNGGLYIKPGRLAETTLISGEGTPVDFSRSLNCQNPSFSVGNTGASRPPSHDQATSRDLLKANEPIELPSILCPSPVKLSFSAHSVSSQSTSPLSSQSHWLPPNSNHSKWNHLSPGHVLLRQASGSWIPETKAPTFSISEEASSLVPSWGNESARDFHGGSSNGWSVPAFSELTTNLKDRWSFDSETSGFSLDKNTRPSGVNPACLFDSQTCGVCTNLLSERSSSQWRNRMSSNELAVISVLTCGHVYHAECLEKMTPEVNKFDPDCPVCVYGEKHFVKMSEKAMKAELDPKPRKRFRKRVVDSDTVFDWHKSRVEGRDPRMSSSSSMKSSVGKPFFQRHFSFGFKFNRSMSENQSSRRKDTS